jgi:putative phosphoribosyl transferase
MIFAKREFADRHEAGRRLAEHLQRFAGTEPLVLALPRGGVPVAFEVARALGAELDVVLVRKLGAPDHPEYGIGAVVDGDDPQVVLNEEALAVVRPSAAYIAAEERRELAEIERRRKLYHGDRGSLPVKGRTVIVVDDGIATGGTVRAALKALRKAGAGHIVLAVPVAPPDTIDRLAADADEIVCLATPERFHAVGLYYADFTQTTDEEVVHLLKEARGFAREKAG